MMKIPELLVPAGGMEQLKAAVANGADAVYLAGKAFNARKNAENFSEEELQEAIALAHRYGVKVHIALNTLIHDDELKDAWNYIVRLYRYGADALILQDRGLASLVHRNLPDFSMHLSTQGTVCDADGVREAAEDGFSRVILSREVSLSQLKKIREAVSTELEIFVHGAICISYSGQCRMSGVLGGRSGNRGECAQPCRLPYRLTEKMNSAEPEANPWNYILSPSDLCLVGHLKEIAESSVDSLKLEGRMKSPEYVAVVTGIYRRYLDDLASGKSLADPDPEDQLSLLQIFNRGGFTDAYFRGESGTALMSTDLPKHRGVAIGRVLSIDRRKGHALVQLTSSLANGDGVEIRIPGNSSTPVAGNRITYISVVPPVFSGTNEDAGRSRNQNRSATRSAAFGKDFTSRQKGRSGASRNTLTGSADDRHGRSENQNRPGNPEKRRLVKQAEKGMVVEIGDILELRHWKGSLSGAELFKITDRILLQEARESWRKIPPRIPVNFRFTAEAGQPAVLRASVTPLSVGTSGLPECSAAVSSEEITAPATATRTGEETVTRSLQKTGDTPFRIRHTEIRLHGNPWLPASLLNRLRREVLDQLMDGMLAPYRERMGKAEILPSWEEVSSGLSVRPVSAKKSALPEQATDAVAADDALRIVVAFFPSNHWTETADRWLDARAHRSNFTSAGAGPAIEWIFPAFPGDPERWLEETKGLREKVCKNGWQYSVSMPVVTWGERAVRPAAFADALMRPENRAAFHALCLTSPSQLESVQPYGVPFCFEESTNLYNRFSVAHGMAKGMERGVLSCELRTEDCLRMKTVASHCEITVAGRIPVMQLEHCLIGQTPAARPQKERKGDMREQRGTTRHCTAEQRYHFCRRGEYAMENKKGMVFPVLADDTVCRNVLLSPGRVSHLPARVHTGNGKPECGAEKLLPPDPSKLDALMKAGFRTFRINVYDENPDESCFSVFYKMLYSLT